MYRTGVLNTLSIQQIEQIVKKNLCWQRQRLCFCGELCYNERKEKQALHNAAFAFLAPLTNGSPAAAGSRARQCGIRE